MSRRSWPSAYAVQGFTLIEVIGALVIFSLGVLMVVQVSGALGRQMRWAGARSELAVLADERLDSLEARPFASLATGTAVDTLTVEGFTYEQTVTVSAITAVLKRIDVAFAAVGGGPPHAVTSYASGVW